MYTEEQIQEWKSKAEKWDRLDETIGAMYVKEGEKGEWEENDDEGTDLSSIGEAATIAFGWL